VEWLRANGRDEEYIRDQVRFLDKYMRPIRCPADVVAMFAECRRSKDHLNKAFRNLPKELASNYSSEPLIFYSQ